MCAETLPWKCHRRLIGDELWARGLEIVHLLGLGEQLPHQPFDQSEARNGRLYLCGTLVAESSEETQHHGLERRPGPK